MKQDNYCTHCIDKKNKQNSLLTFDEYYLKMGTVFMNTLNSKTNESNRFMHQFTDKSNLKNPNKNMALANLNIHYTWKNIKSEYNNNKFKIHASTWNEFNLPDGSYSVSDINDYFEYIIKKHETIADNPPVQICVNKIKNRIVFKIKTGYKLELLTKETRELFIQKKTLIKTKMEKLYQD